MTLTKAVKRLTFIVKERIKTGKKAKETSHVGSRTAPSKFNTEALKNVRENTAKILICLGRYAARTFKKTQDDSSKRINRKRKHETTAKLRVSTLFSARAYVEMY